MRKRLLSILLAGVLVLSQAGGVLAAENTAADGTSAEISETEEAGGEDSGSEGAEETEEDAAINLIMSELLKELKTATPVAQQPVPAQPAIQVETPPSIQIPQEPKSNNNTTNNNNDDSYQALSGVSIIDNNQDMGYTAQPEDIKEPTPTVDEEEFEEKPKKKFNLSLILLIVLLVLVGYILYSSTIHKKQIQQLNFNCTPVTSYKEEKELDVDSTLVQSLYKKVATSIREDVAQPEWNDNMKLYLAYRQILDSDKYDTNCNMFDDASMEPYTCEVSTTFIPKGFKQEVLILEWKKLFGEDTPITLTNIKLENSCVGGYQYIKEREEFVQGYCAQPTATSYKVTKKLTKAVTYRNTIIPSLAEMKKWNYQNH